MMKKLLIATLVLAAGIGSAFAQKADDKNNCPNQCNKTECAKADKKCDMACATNPFEGLNLTAEQKSKLEALKTECKGRMEQAKADRKKDREARAEQRNNGRAEMLAKIKEILTPEQYVKFLENNFLNNHGNKPGMQGKKDGKHNNKPGKPGKPQQRDRR